MNNRLSQSQPSEVASSPGGNGPRTITMTRIQRTIARRMTAAKAEVPEFVAETEVDMGAVHELRADLKRGGAFVPSYNDLIVKACALALRRVPQVNASYTPDGFQIHDRVNIGVAVAAERALIVPTVFEADWKSVEQIGHEVRALAAKVRDGSIRAEELADQTFTVSNLGMHGVRRFTAIINPPQAGILATGAVEDRVAARDGRPVVRLRMSAVLTSDHRVVYGADAAEFLAAFRAALEAPADLVGKTNDLSEAR